jgi:hypothetical protein
MASGHVYRANRPNTWPLRPTPQSPIASFRHDAEFGRYRGIADMAGLAGSPPPSRMTPSRHSLIQIKEERQRALLNVSSHSVDPLRKQ